MPTIEVHEALERGDIDIAIGGCCIEVPTPTHRCSLCGTDILGNGTAQPRPHRAGGLQ